MDYIMNFACSSYGNWLISNDFLKYSMYIRQNCLPRSFMNSTFSATDLGDILSDNEMMIDIAKAILQSPVSSYI